MMTEPKKPLPAHEPIVNPGKDPLFNIYHEGFVDNPNHRKYLANHATALLTIDLQYLDAAEGHGVFKDIHSASIPESYQRYYFDSLKATVLPNVQKLQKTFRSHELELIHTRIQALTQNGRDRSIGHRRLNLLAKPGSKEAEFLPEVAPQGDEIVINKTASGVFSSTNLNYVLTNMNINALYICGVYTNECVETTVRDACDLGYLVTLVDDACTTVTKELHQASLATLRDRYARVVSTAEAIAEIEASVERLPRARRERGEGQERSAQAVG
jgi:nicotinamidase-related amidase